VASEVLRVEGFRSGIKRPRRHTQKVVGSVVFELLSTERFGLVGESGFSKSTVFGADAAHPSTRRPRGWSRAQDERHYALEALGHERQFGEWVSNGCQTRKRLILN
jgi:ABC-type glutathione transport system ATPase component